MVRLEKSLTNPAQDKNTPDLETLPAKVYLKDKSLIPLSLK